MMTIVANPRNYKIPEWFLNRQKDHKTGRFAQVRGGERGRGGACLRTRTQTLVAHAHTHMCTHTRTLVWLTHLPLRCTH